MKQYADWRASIAANSLNPTYDQDADWNDLNTVAHWSTEIDHRKDLWKYVEITSTTIKEWKLTFINRVCDEFNFEEMNSLYFNSLIFLVHEKRSNVG